MEGLKRETPLAAAFCRRCLGAIVFWLCVVCHVPYASADSLPLESGNDRPRWTPWSSSRLLGLGLTQYGIAFTRDTLHGWVVGEEGAILTTSNGGVSWTEQDSGVDVSLYAIHLGSRTGHAWIAGDEGVILSTVDGGATWTKQTSGIGAALYAIHATPDGSAVWAVGSNGVIVHSRDGGVAWVEQESGVDVGLHAVHAGGEAGHVLAAGGEGLILRTVDDGTSWTVQRTGTRQRLRSIHLSADGHRGLIAGGKGVVLSSGDGGATWTMRSSGVDADLRAVRLSAEGDRGWVAGSGGVLLSTNDGGLTWRLHSSGTNRRLHAIHLSADGEHGWVVGRRGVRLSTADGGVTWTIRRKGMSGRLRLNATHLSTDGLHGWMAGEDGVILASTDGGATWTQQDSGTCTDLLGFHMSEDNLHGWAVGDLGTILATRNGGRTWNEQFIATASEFNSVSLADDGLHGWAVGECGIVFATADGGVRWRKVDIGTEVDLHAIHTGGNGLRAWAVGEDGAIFGTSDGGTTWASQHSRTDRDLRSVYFLSDGSRGWAAGDAGTILVTVDGGANWTKKASGTENDLWDIDFSSDGTLGWVAGDEGTILKTTDGGAVWIGQFAGTESDLRSIHFSDDGVHGWIVGHRGTILATSHGGTSWTVRTTSRRTDFVATYFADDNLSGWAISDDGDVVVTHDGGNTWVQLPDHLPINLNSIHMARDGRSGWAVGSRGSVLTTDDGWATWTRRLVAARFHLNAVHGAAEGRQGWAVTDDGRILSTGDGGGNWAISDSETEGELNAIEMTADGRRGWAVGANGTVLATRDAGETWSVQNSGTDRDLNGIYMVADGLRGLAVGRGGTIIATDDGGTSWTVKDSDCTEVLNSVRMVPDRLQGWVVGGDGTVLSTADGGNTWAKTPVEVDFDLEAIAIVGFGEALRGWVVGRANRILLPAKSNGTPYLTSFNATTRPNGDVLLEFATKDEEGDQTNVLKIEMCRVPITEPLCEELDQASLVEHNDRWSLNWDPDSNKIHDVKSGDRLKFKVTLRDHEDRFPFVHTTAGLWQYRVWYLEVWNRHTGLAVSALVVVSVFILYVLTVLGIFAFNPVLLLRISRILSWKGDTSSLSDRPVRLLFLTFHATALSYFATHQRTRRAWIRHYENTDVRITNLAPSIRKRYLNDDEVLDAWVEKRTARARDAIASKDTVKTRALFVEIPISLDSGDQHREAGSKVDVVALVRNLLQRQRGVMAICGPGGSGKTTFAAQIARWTCSEDRDERVLPHNAIPVWIESETSDLVKDVIRELCEMVGVDDTDDDIVRALLVEKRVLVIVDALSERTRATRDHVCRIYGTKDQINALILTSRVEPDMERLPIARLRLIDDETIVPFIQQYALFAHKHVRLAGRMQLRIAERALAIVERRGKRVPMTPLLVCMFVDGAVEQIEQSNDLQHDELVDSVPEIIIEYLERVNPQAEDTPDRLDNRVMIRSVKALSSAELEPDFVPKELVDEDALAVINEVRKTYLDGGGTIGVDAESIVRRLVKNDVVETRCRLGTRFLRIKFDPVAEYLAAIDWTERNGSKESDWDALFERLEREDFAGEGFLLALFDVVSTFGDDRGVPVAVREKLESFVSDTSAPEC